MHDTLYLQTKEGVERKECRSPWDHWKEGGGGRSGGTGGKRHGWGGEEWLLHVGAPVGGVLKLIQFFLLYEFISPGSKHTALLEIMEYANMYTDGSCLYVHIESSLVNVFLI